MLKRIASGATIIVLALTFFACDKQAESSNTFADPSQSSAEKVAEKAAETTRAAELFTLQKKREYEQMIQVELENFESLIADLKSKAKNAKAEAKDVLSQSVEDLERKKETLQKRLEEFESATAAASQRIETAVEAALDDLKKSYDKATSELR